MDHYANGSILCRSRWLLVLIAGAALFLSASGIQAQQQTKDNKVEVKTPWGGASVSNEATMKELGLPAYPGARLHKESPSDDPSASFSLWTSSLGLKLVVAKYESDDAMEKVTEFYQKALAKHGKVLRCTSADKKPDKKDESKELDCSDTDVEPGAVELRAGTKERRHIVAIRPREKGKGSEFALVYLEAIKKGKEPL